MPSYNVHLTDDVLSDLGALYREKGESAEPIRNAFIAAALKLKLGEWDDSLIKIRGFSGTQFSYDFCSEYIFTFTIDTYRDEHKQPIEEHYYLKNLFLKK
jgi:hypothetical protein